MTLQLTRKLADFGSIELCPNNWRVAELHFGLYVCAFLIIGIAGRFLQLEYNLKAQIGFFFKEMKKGENQEKQVRGLKDANKVVLEIKKVVLKSQSCFLHFIWDKGTIFSVCLHSRPTAI